MSSNRKTINPLDLAQDFLRGLLVGKRVKIGRYRKLRQVRGVEIAAESAGLDGDDSYPIARLWFEGDQEPIDTTGDVEIVE
jgi:hypothetical protein